MVKRIQPQLGLLAVLAVQCVDAPRDRCVSSSFGEHQINDEPTMYHQWVSVAQPAVATGAIEALVVFTSALERGDAPSRSEIVLLKLGADANVRSICDDSSSKTVVMPSSGSGFERLKWPILADTPKRDGPVLLVYGRQLQNDLAPHELYAMLIDRNGCITEDLVPALLTSPGSSASPATPSAVGVTLDSFLVLWPVVQISRFNMRGALQARLVSATNAEPQLSAGPSDLDVAGRMVTSVRTALAAPDRIVVAYTYMEPTRNTNAALMIMNGRFEQGPTIVMGSPADAQDVIMSPSIGVGLHGETGLLVWTERDEMGIQRARARRFRSAGMVASALDESWWLSPDAIEVGAVAVLAVAPDRYIVTYDARTDKYGPGDRQNLLMQVLGADGDPLFTRRDCHDPPRPVQVNQLVTENSQTDLSLVATNAGEVYGVFTDWGDTETTGSDRSGASIHAVHLKPLEL